MQVTFANGASPRSKPVKAGSASAKVWAPTAQNVELLLFEESTSDSPVEVIPMSEDITTGVWSASAGNWDRKFYKYRVTVFTSITNQVEINDVTDPYSLSLSTNSQLSQFVNLSDRDLKPRGWDWYRKPRLRAPEDISIYELHVRDFSIIDETVKERDRGTFNAFSQYRSRGMRHLRSLAYSGLSHIHLLPAFDIATVNENKDELVSIDIDLTQFAPDSIEQQAAVVAIQNQDGFNWGYDPLHFTVPEGSYSTNPDGVTRIKEFRQMVRSLNRLGLRVVMDVVYNHTYKSGLDDLSVLDKVVPGYYHRRHPITGAIEQSTCCENTATEHVMMGKLMTDSLVVWARDYKIDGFRFDLMGHQPRGLMLEARDAVHAVDPDNYFYGEGWNFGEVANNAQFRQATQVELHD